MKVALYSPDEQEIEESLALFNLCVEKVGPDFNFLATFNQLDYRRGSCVRAAVDAIEASSDDPRGQLISAITMGMMCGLLLADMRENGSPVGIEAPPGEVQ